jgi:hypothetical protein
MSESIAAVTGPHVLIARQYLRAVYPAAMASAEHEPDPGHSRSSAPV